MMDVRPREERSLREMYHDYSASIWSQPITLMNVPNPQEVEEDDEAEMEVTKTITRGPEEMEVVKRMKEADRRSSIIRIKEGEGMFSKKGFPLEKILPGAVKRIERAKEKSSNLCSVSEKISGKVNLNGKFISGTTNNSRKTVIQDVLVESSNKRFKLDHPFIRDSVQEDYSMIIEYDMDSVDRQALILIERELSASKKRISISPLLFEYLIDRFEKYWHSLISPIVQRELSSMLLPDDDTICAICGSGEACNSDAIVLCDRCDVAVHQGCYGIPNVPEGKWLCLKCAWAPNERVECVVCPFQSEGAFKQTEEPVNLQAIRLAGKSHTQAMHRNRGNESNKTAVGADHECSTIVDLPVSRRSTGWCHSICAHWLDELSFSNDTYLEPITGATLIPTSRFKLVCRLCKVKQGAPIQCSNRQCGYAYHPMCMLKANLLTDFKHKKSWCPKHTPLAGRHALRGVSFRGEEVRVDHAYFLPAHIRRTDQVNTRSVDATPKNKNSGCTLKSKNLTQCRMHINIEDSEPEFDHPDEIDHQDTERVALIPTSVATSISCTNLSVHSDKVSQMTPIVPESIIQLIQGTLDEQESESDIKGNGNHIDSRSCIDATLRQVKKDWQAVPRDKRHAYFIAMAHYWTLKRAFKGASFIRRLQMEPAPQCNDDADESSLLSSLLVSATGHRRNLEFLRNLLDLYKTTVTLQLRSRLLNGRIFSLWKAPLLMEMQCIINALKEFDSKKRIFSVPVNANLVPDYYMVIKEPMDLTTMQEKLTQNFYHTLKELKVIYLMLDLC